MTFFRTCLKTTVSDESILTTYHYYLLLLSTSWRLASGRPKSINRLWRAEALNINMFKKLSKLHCISLSSFILRQIAPAYSQKHSLCCVTAGCLKLISRTSLWLKRHRCKSLMVKWSLAIAHGGELGPATFSWCRVFFLPGWKPFLQP